MLWKRRRKSQHRRNPAHTCQHGPGRHCRECDSRPHCSLREVKPGCRAVVHGFREGMPANRRTQLQAYGLLPGQALSVRQQYPVTVIQIDCTELALEWDLAEAVEVEI